MKRAPEHPVNSLLMAVLIVGGSIVAFCCLGGCALALLALSSGGPA
jgi:hypothetical protein